MCYTKTNTRKHANHKGEGNPTMNNTKTNKIAEAASILASRAANLAVMQALTDAWNSLTNEQRDNITANVGNYDQVTVAISIEGDSARLVDDEWHRGIGADNQAADVYVRAVETSLSNINSGAQYLGETWDGADPEEGVSYRPLYYTEGDLDTARNAYMVACEHMNSILAAK